MTKSLYYKIIPYYGHIIKIIAHADNIAFPSGATDPISIDILVNGNSILISGETLYLTESNSITVLEKHFEILPKDKIRVDFNAPNGTIMKNLEVRVIATKI